MDDYDLDVMKPLSREELREMLDLQAERDGHMPTGHVRMPPAALVRLSRLSLRARLNDGDGFDARQFVETIR